MNNSSVNQSSPTPKFGTIDVWVAISGISRRVTYDLLGSGDLKARKVGSRTLIDIQQGLAWIENQPAPQIRASKPKQAA